MSKWRNVMLITLSVVLAAACTTGKQQDDISDQQIESMVRKTEQSDPFLRSQRDVGLHAYWSGPGVLQVRVKNKTARPMEIRPDFFGLLYVSQDTVKQSLPSSRQSFPILNLQPDEEAAGVLKFDAPGRNDEVRLVFSHEDRAIAPAMAPITSR